MPTPDSAGPVQTNWSVITGTSCSGKTTVIAGLEERGFKCVAEAARIYFEQELGKGRSMEEIRSNEPALQRQLAKLRAENEDRLEPTQLVFLDRAMPDSVSYANARGYDSSELMRLARRYRYRRVFLLERLPFTNDRVRTESEQTSIALERRLVEDYNMLGYELIKIPVIAVEQRIELILSHLD